MYASIKELVVVPAVQFTRVLIEKDSECPICLEPIMEGNRCGVLACSHAYHPHCIQKSPYVDHQLYNFTLIYYPNVFSPVYLIYKNPSLSL